MPKKIIRRVIIFSLIFVFLSTLVISYIALKQLVYNYDFVLDKGLTQSQVANNIKTELFQKYKNLENVSFQTIDNIKISGLFLKRDNAKANLLLCHGYQRRKEFMANYIDLFPNYNILLFDFRAHGESSGEIRSMGCVEDRDVLAAVNFFKEKTNNLPLIILGLSMGGTCALKALESNPDICQALILESSYSNLKKVIYHTFSQKSGLPSFPFLYFLEIFVNFYTNSRIKDLDTTIDLPKIKTPIFFIHSCVDKVVPTEHTLAMYAKCHSPIKKLWITPKCKHCKLTQKFTDIYSKKVNKFLDKALA